MRAADAMRDATERLAAVSDTARLDAELLMAHAFGVTRSDLLLRHGEAPVPQDRFEALLIRRLAHEPIAYILGSQAFLGLDLMVNTDVLIPRGDSESVVEAALEAMPDPERVLDCGTGSGALLLAVLSQRPAASGIGIDRSLGALALAAANAAKLGLADRAHMLHADWHEPGWADGLGLFDLIIANPPYVESGAVLDPSVARYEPAEALYAGADGLDDYRVLVPQLPELLAPGGKVVLEIGATQADAVAALGQAAGFESGVRHDLAGRPRAVILSRC
ncbi:MAG: peptide chain release factor N(5)-glutamine methyltransferase [Novosphingobium sp.]